MIQTHSKRTKCYAGLRYDVKIHKKNNKWSNIIKTMRVNTIEYTIIQDAFFFVSHSVYYTKAETQGLHCPDDIFQLSRIKMLWFR